jgi:hypothetical protein
LHWILFPTKTHNRTLLKHGRHFDYWNQLLNMCMRVSYLDCHEVGLCCYQVRHTETLYSCFTSFCGLFTDPST